MKKSFLAWCILIASTATLQAAPATLDPIVVTATRTATPLSQIASSVTVITAEEIEEKQQHHVLEVLRSVPGLGLVQSGPSGGQTSIHMRGTDTKHTLILIDGIEYRDASSVGGGANLSNLTTDNVERIEVVRGAQSVIYGSDAIGGVINIITKKGSQLPEAYLSVEGGSYNTWKESAGLSASGENTRTSFTVSRTDSDGFSSYNENDGFNEKDGYTNTSASFNIGADLSKKFTLNLNMRLTDSEYEFDSGYFDSSFNYVKADTDAVTDTLELAGRTEGVLSLYDGKWTLIMGASLTDTNRTTTGTYDNYKYDGSITKLDLQNNIKISDSQTLVVGLETEKEDYASSYGDQGEARTQAAFIQDQIKIGNFSVAVGVRVDKHDEFGTETTWRIAPAYTAAATGTKLKASAGTGFKTPSLFQLYYPYGGNKDLDPETSKSFDAGFEQPLLDNSLIVAVSWFYNDIDDYIDWYDVAGYLDDGYRNIKELKTTGVESTVNWYPNDLVALQVGYTYTDSKDEENDRKARIPLHKGTFDITLYPVDDLQFNLNVLHVSERDDGTANETLDSYTLVNLASSYQVTNTIKLFGRIQNLLDKEYEEVAGYGTAGVSAYAGLKVTF